MNLLGLLANDMGEWTLRGCGGSGTNGNGSSGCAGSTGRGITTGGIATTGWLGGRTRSAGCSWTVLVVCSTENQKQNSGNRNLDIRKIPDETKK
jgi:hypothetical protein